MKSDYTSSIKFDKRLYKQDILGSIAHVNMLSKQSIIKEKVTVNFENVGKKVINSKNIELKKIEKNA